MHRQNIWFTLMLNDLKSMVLKRFSCQGPSNWHKLYHIPPVGNILPQGTLWDMAFDLKCFITKTHDQNNLMLHVDNVTEKINYFHFCWEPPQGTTCVDEKLSCLWCSHHHHHQITTFITHKHKPKASWFSKVSYDKTALSVVQ